MLIVLGKNETAIYTISMTIWTNAHGHTYLEHVVQQLYSSPPSITTGFGLFLALA